jgi:hypothetical protein
MLWFTFQVNLIIDFKHARICAQVYCRGTGKPAKEPYDRGNFGFASVLHDNPYRAIVKTFET